MCGVFVIFFFSLKSCSWICISTTRDKEIEKQETEKKKLFRIDCGKCETISILNWIKQQYHHINISNLRITQKFRFIFLPFFICVLFFFLDNLRSILLLLRYCAIYFNTIFVFFLLYLLLYGILKMNQNFPFTMN